ncbi:MAG TPA: hypothetical protein VHV78_18555 [Gemmatimonadaceae bacterium]|nr:hypothetical protein [Gemmatimonadaceae bacterium]
MITIAVITTTLSAMISGNRGFFAGGVSDAGTVADDATAAAGGLAGGGSCGAASAGAAGAGGPAGMPLDGGDGPADGGDNEAANGMSGAGANGVGAAAPATFGGIEIDDDAIAGLADGGVLGISKRRNNRVKSPVARRSGAGTLGADGVGGGGPIGGITVLGCDPSGADGPAYGGP